MKYYILVISLISLLSCSRSSSEKQITISTLLDEMIDLERLAIIPEIKYKTVQYSSYDRRSIRPTDSCWFSNEDGFGNEPIPGFEKVLKLPDANGIGEYLICDIQEPGAVLRLWTAGINGKIRLFLDDTRKPFYEGNAEDFFWKTAESLSGNENSEDYQAVFRQFDATYFPVPFSSRCRIEWIGDIKAIHFYHVGIRIYDPDTSVETFSPGELSKCAEKLEKISGIFKSGGEKQVNRKTQSQKSEIIVNAGSKVELFTLDSTRAIDYLSVKIIASDIESVLRKNILSIYFDNSSVPQVQAPLGDFFGAAPGLNPYLSLPFEVEKDSTMICRFVMPFKKNARIEINNRSEQNIHIIGETRSSDYNWVDGKSMHFRARWKISNGLTATGFNAGSSDISDVLYLMAQGKGRLVGVAAYIYNPSNAVTSWGNWWGEGDEKIYVDKDIFPSFFGTGSEDYFNYSWSSSKIFSYPYCGQPRNDGPGNRGYVSNYRWHISDDILFDENMAFYMELGHHGIVPGFSYGRIAYYYALPGMLDSYEMISMDDIRDIEYRYWTPEAYLGSEGFRFIQSENIATANKNLKIEKGNLCSEGHILSWFPSVKGETISFRLHSQKAIDSTNIGFTLEHSTDGGVISLYVNGNPVKLSGKEYLDLSTPFYKVLDNHFSEKININTGDNEITLKLVNSEKDKKVGIDFIWIK